MDKNSAHPRNKQKKTISMIVVGVNETKTWECDTEFINVTHFFKIIAVDYVINSLNFFNTFQILKIFLCLNLK